MYQQIIRLIFFILDIFFHMILYFIKQIFVFCCLFVNNDETMCSLNEKQTIHFENVYYIWRITKRSIKFRWIFLVHAIFFIVRNIFEWKARFFDIQTVNKTFFIHFLRYDNISVFALIDQLASNFKSWKKWINIFLMLLVMFFRVFLMIDFKNNEFKFFHFFLDNETFF